MKINVRNLFHYLRSEIISTVVDSTHSSRIFCFVLTLFYSINFISSRYEFNLEDIFGITPGYLIPPNFWIWTLVSHGFVETTLFFLVTGYTVILGSSRLLEPLWGQLEFSIFFGRDIKYFNYLCLFKSMKTVFHDEIFIRLKRNRFPT